MEKIFTTRLKQQLAKYIRGCISAHFIANDILLVEIDNNVLYYRYVLNDISTRICNGLTSDAVCKDICKEYKRYIFNKYFFSKSGENS